MVFSCASALGDRDAGIESPQGEPVARSFRSIPFVCMSRATGKNMRGSGAPATGCLARNARSGVAVSEVEASG